MNFLNNSASLVPLALAAVIFFWKAHRWRHPMRPYWAACLMLLAVVTFVGLLTGYVLDQLAAFGRSPQEIGGAILGLTLGGWIAGRSILSAAPKPFRRVESSSPEPIEAPIL